MLDTSQRRTATARKGILLLVIAASLAWGALPSGAHGKGVRIFSGAF
jgi:hypothetical protein